MRGRKVSGGPSVPMGTSSAVSLWSGRTVTKTMLVNRASERVLEKNGFRLEETKTGAVVKGGKAMDVRVYMLV